MIWHGSPVPLVTFRTPPISVSATLLETLQLPGPGARRHVSGRNIQVDGYRVLVGVDRVFEPADSPVSVTVVNQGCGIVDLDLVASQLHGFSDGQSGKGTYRCCQNIRFGVTKHGCDQPDRNSRFHFTDRIFDSVSGLLPVRGLFAQFGRCGLETRNGLFQFVSGTRIDVNLCF